MELFRICRARHGATAWDGEGARLHGGRWNRHGIPMVYASESLSLATLELLVHGNYEEAPDDLVATSMTLPKNIVVERLQADRLPRDWRSYPAPEMLQELGSTWARSLKTACLAVPSAVVPSEWNYLLNPRHPTFDRLRPKAATAFSLDRRLFGR